MKKHTLKTTVIAFIVICLFACKKDTSPTAVSLTGFVKTQTNSYGSVSYTNEYFYDSNGRLDSVIMENNAGRMILDRTSTSKISMKMIANATNSLIIYEDIYLNNNNITDSTFQYNNTKDSSTEKYTYNAQSKLINYKRFRYHKLNSDTVLSEKNYQYDTNGNVITEIISVPNVANPTTNTFVYTNYLNTAKLGNDYFIQQNYYLPSKQVTTSSGTSTTINYTYTFDNNNRLQTETQTKNGSPYQTITYTYY